MWKVYDIIIFQLYREKEQRRRKSAKSLKQKLLWSIQVERSNCKIILWSTILLAGSAIPIRSTSIVVVVPAKRKSTSEW